MECQPRVLLKVAQFSIDKNLQTFDPEARNGLRKKRSEGVAA